MRYFVPALLLSVTAGACGSAPSDPAPPSTSTASLSSAPTGDTADTSCQVVLRHTAMNFQGRLGPQTDCSSGTCWVMVWITFDLAMNESLAEAGAYVLYRAEGAASWQQSAQAQPMFGAPEGFRRYQVVLNSGTLLAGQGAKGVSIIPFVTTGSGGRVFDHNRVPDPMGAYTLDVTNNWTIGDNPSACPGAVPAKTLSLGFAEGWSNTVSGALAGGGKIDVTYDLQRLPQTLSCRTDGVAAFATMGYVQFQPGGQVLGERINGPYDATANTYASTPLEFDVPAGTTSASLWFVSSSDCGGPYWDSNFGRNYLFTAQ